jgi:hypothetical protein
VQQRCIASGLNKPYVQIEESFVSIEKVILANTEKLVGVLGIPAKPLR